MYSTDTMCWPLLQLKGAPKWACSSPSTPVGKDGSLGAKRPVDPACPWQETLRPEVLAGRWSRNGFNCHKVLDKGYSPLMLFQIVVLDQFEDMNKSQISASCFLTFEKADCTIFTQLVGWLFDVTIYFPFPNSFLLFLLSSSYPLQIKYFPPSVFLHKKYFPFLNTFLLFLFLLKNVFLL